MANKSNIRSMRFSDDILAMIESQTGDTFTAKFENLVTRCMWELPQREEELRQIESQIDYQRRRLESITNKANELENSIYRMSSTVQSYSTQAKVMLVNLNKLIDEA